MLSENEARNLTDDIRRDLESLWDKVIRAWEGEAHRALGYESWQSYCSGEFDSDYLSVPRSERPRVVAMLREHGMSTRAIAATVNVSKGTIDNDVANFGHLPHVDPPAVKGTDGKQYPATKPKSDATPEPATEPESCTPDSCGPDNSVEEAITRLNRLLANLHKSRIITPDQHRKLEKILEREYKWHATSGQ